MKSIDIVAAKQSFRTPTIVKSGDKEVVRTRGFTKVSTTLTLNGTGFADEVPPFNPLKVLTGARNGVEQQLPEPAPAQDDAEVSFVTRDLGTEQTPLSAASLSLPEVQAQVTEHVKNMLAAGSKPSLALPGAAPADAHQPRRARRRRRACLRQCRRCHPALAVLFDRSADDSGKRDARTEERAGASSRRRWTSGSSSSVTANRSRTCWPPTMCRATRSRTSSPR